MSLYQELLDLCSVLENASAQEITPRLLHIVGWMDCKPEIKTILDDLRNDQAIIEMVQLAHARTPPIAVTARQIAGIGLSLVDACAKDKRKMLAIVALNWGMIRSGNMAEESRAMVQRYVAPFLDYVLVRLPGKPAPRVETGSSQPFIPIAIQESLEAFRVDYSDSQKVCFIMMQFSETEAHSRIEQSIKTTLSRFGFTGILARDKQYHDELYPNIQTYMHGCGFGIAVFERIEKDDFNPNVSLEIGYMLGLKKAVLLLKEKTLPSLQADLVGKLYHPFDVQNISKTIPAQIERWMEDKRLI